MSERFAAALVNREAEAALGFHGDSVKATLGAVHSDIKHLRPRCIGSAANHGIKQGWSLKFDREA